MTAIDKAGFANNTVKKLPYGQCNFAGLVARNYAYVDKTRYIETLENENTTYHIMLRPRRFGKSLFLSVLANYYDINRKDKLDELFGQFYIGKNPTPDQGAYAIMRFDFSTMDMVSRELFRVSFLGEIKRGTDRFLKEYESHLRKASYGDMSVGEPMSEITALLSAFEAAESADIPVFILIDEYDNFANDLLTMSDAYRTEVMSDGIVRTFYKALKAGTSSAVRRIFMTGVSPMMVSDLTSGFNMVTNLSLIPKYNEMFGFTEEDVKWLAGAAGIDMGLIDVDMEYYYNGYRFCSESQERVYNSQMVLFLFDQIQQLGKQPSQVVDPNLKTSYERLRRLAIDEDNRDRILGIIKDGGTAGDILTAFSVDELNQDENFISLLFYLGMLTFGTVNQRELYLKIPNYSTQTLYWEYLMEYISRGLGEKAIDTAGLSAVVHDLAYKGEVVPYINFFIDNFFKRLSNRDLRDFDEKYIKIMMLASLCMSRHYAPVSEAENINGYSDIYLAKKNIEPDVLYEYIFEVKYIKKGSASKKEIERKFDEAHKQVKKYKADTRFAGRSDIIYVTLVFIGKDTCEMRVIEA